MDAKDRRFLREIAIGAMSIAALAGGWYYLVPLITHDADRDWISAVAFGVTGYLAIRWAAH